jgi:hypothetical protein
LLGCVDVAFAGQDVVSRKNELGNSAPHIRDKRHDRVACLQRYATH